MSFVEHRTDYLREVWVPIMEEVDKWSLFFEGKGNIKLVFEFCLCCSCSSVMLWEASLILLHVHQSLVGVIITPDPWCLSMEETEEKETIVLLTLWSMQSVPSRRRIRERGTKVWFTSIMNLIQSAGIWCCFSDGKRNYEKFREIALNIFKHCFHENILENKKTNRSVLWKFRKTFVKATFLQWWGMRAFWFHEIF